MKQKATWIGLSHFTPAPGDGRLGGGRLTAGGAFAHASAIAGSRREFTARVRTALATMGFRMLGIEDAEPLATRMRTRSVAPALLRLAKKAERSGTVELDNFYVYPETRRGVERVTPSLAHAARLRQLVYVDVVEGDGPEGAIVGVGRQLLLLHRLNSGTMTFTGYIALPLREVAGVHPLTDFRADVLSSFGARPSPLPDVPLDNLKDLLSWASDRFGLVAVFRERIRSDASWVGRVQKVSDKELVMKLVDRRANWLRPYRAWLRAVTRIDFGNAYLRLLAAAVGRSRTRSRAQRRSGSRSAR